MAGSGNANNSETLAVIVPTSTFDAVNRITNLPLLNSAFNLVSSAYSSTKEMHPCLSGVCNVAETVAAVAVGSVVGGAQPILNQLDSQIALVNEYACKRLDQLEENLPFLQQPADKVKAFSGEVMGARDLVTNKVTEAVDLTKHIVEDSVGLTKSAIQESVEITNSVVTNSVSKAKAVGQAVAGGVESVLGISEDLVDHYLPMTEEELGEKMLSELATAVEGFGMASVEEQKQQQSYFVRLGSLSKKVRHRAYQLSLNKLQHVKQSTQNTLSQLQLAINLIESVKKEVGQKLLDGQEKLHQLWVSWCLTQPKGHQVKTIESRTLAMLHIITQQLQPIFENLKVSIHGLPRNIQEAVHQATRNIKKLHTTFASANSFQDLSSTTLTKSQNHVAEAQRSLDVLFEYVTQSTPLNWLVGPFKAIAKVMSLQ
uniref:Perilipin n=1 Tax=Pavo cristatus TaxID=9049 RepID=A0A8C9ES74_PAVCR